eukprot:3741411-Amphidinium_carterae.1
MPNMCCASSTTPTFPQVANLIADEDVSVYSWAMEFSVATCLVHKRTTLHLTLCSDANTQADLT